LAPARTGAKPQTWLTRMCTWRVTR
jgi:hypothetical protein